MFNKYKAFIFDFDGVLADSVEIKTKAFAILFEKYGSEIQSKVAEYHRNNGGMTRRDKFVYYYQNFLNKSFVNEDIDDLCREFSALVVDKVVAAQEIPGSVKFLKTWHNKVKCFVVSATPDEEIREIARKRGINFYFEKILGSSCFKTEHVKFLIKKYGLNSDQCLFFGDAGSDYRAAIESSVDFIGILPDSNAPLLQIAPDILWYRDFLEFNSKG